MSASSLFRKSISRFRSIIAINLLCIFYCTLYCIVGPAMILLNAHIFTKTDFAFPISVSSFGMLACVFITRLIVATGIIVPNTKPTKAYWFTRLLPLGLNAAITICAGNMVYKYLSVSFTQMLKAQSPLYILMVMIIFRVRMPSCRSITSVVIITIGTCIASIGEIRFSWIGFSLQTLAGLTEAIKLVLLQTSMADDNLSPFESLLFMSTTTGLCQAVFAVAFEPTALPSLVDQPTSTLLLLLASSVLGAIVNLLTLQVINYTSGLALKLLGVFRNNLPVVLSTLFLHEEISLVQFFGYITSVVGFLWYTHLQSYPTSPVEVEPDDDKAIELEEGRAE